MKEEQNRNRMVILDTYANSIQASLAKAKLDAFGIPCVLTGEIASELYPFPADGFSGIKLYVLMDDVNEARDILKESSS